MARLHDELAALAARGIPGPDSRRWPRRDGALGQPLRASLIRPSRVVPGPVTGGSPASSWWWRAGRGPCSTWSRRSPGVRVVAARGEGDDEIAGQAGRLPGQRIVVTADRELRRRCEAAGAAVVGPRWLTRLLA